MGNITSFPLPTLAPIPVEKVLDAARELKDVVVLGWTKGGEEYAASSTGNCAEILLLLERAKIKLLAVNPDEHFASEPTG